MAGDDMLNWMNLTVVDTQNTNKAQCLFLNGVPHHSKHSNLNVKNQIDVHEFFQK